MPCENAKVLVEAYYLSWLNNDRAKARSLLADDLKFRNPRDNFDSADAFMDSCWQLAEHFNSMTIEHAVYDSQGAYIVYQGEGFCCGELLKIKDKKIREIYVTFDPTR